MLRPLRIAACYVLLTAAAGAQEAQSESNPDRIAPPQAQEADPMLTTKRPAATKAQPQEKPAEPAATEAQAMQPFGTGRPPQANRYSPDKIPFGKAAPAAPEIPAGPRTTVATPVDDVDTVDATEPVPPTPVAPEEDPAAQDPAAPTELTSPIFEEKDNPRGPRKIIIRVLNKVTAQSQLFKAEPGAVARFGQLEVAAISCRVSTPGSLKDHAGLFEINEHLPGPEAKKKQLFRGWMYASSPSIAALEHPIYDVTMVACEIADPSARTNDKSDKKPDKKTEKKSRN